MGHSNVLKLLRRSVQCRDKQITRLFQLIGAPTEAVPQNIFLHGISSTGKTFTTTRFLAALGYRHAVVSCDCYSTRLLFESILNQLTGHEVLSADNYASYAKCDTVVDFIYHLRIAAESLNFLEDIFVIVLESCEKLRSKDINLLPALLRLQEFSQLNVCVVLSSDVVFEKFSSEKNSLCQPITIIFPQYTQDEFVEVLFASIGSDEYPEDFYRGYLKLLVQVFYRDCRNLDELQRLADKNFERYCEPIVRGEVMHDDPNKENKLWRNLRPKLKNAIEELHFNMEQKLQNGHDIAESKPVPNEKPNELTFTEKWALGYELPYYTKYLLIAAYLASYNPEKTDKRLFFKANAKQKKTKASINKSKLRDQKLGPKYFSLDRLFAIFYAIIDERLSLTVNLQSQVSTLVKLDLLAVAGDDCVEAPRLKCIVTLDFIKVIAKNMGFNIVKYIHYLM